VVVPATSDGFRAAFSALRSLDGKNGVSFHTYSLPEDRSFRLLIENLGRRMPESVVLEELGSLDIVITRDLHSPICLTSCSALSSDHLPVLIDSR
jgi:hypothetical protein